MFSTTVERPSKDTKTMFLTLPSPGEVLNDAFIIPNFLQKFGFDPELIWRTVRECPTLQGGDTEIPRDKKAFWLPGSHTSLHYRGNALNRKKMWFQDADEFCMLKYGYTGWQHGVSYATRNISSLPILKELQDCLNDKFDDQLQVPLFRQEHHRFNHAIVTSYADHNDYIGMHSDKDRDFETDSFFVCIKLGAARDFAFSEVNANREVQSKKRKRKSSKPAEPKPFFTETLTPGTAVFVGTSSNRLLKHGVPKMNRVCGESGSIVFRCIKTRVPWTQVDKNIQISKRSKQKRDKAKLQKQKTE